MKSSFELVVFAYAFPHRKTQDFLFELSCAGFRRVLVLAAPKKEIGRGTWAPVIHPVLQLMHPFDTEQVCRALEYRYEEISHDDSAGVERLLAGSGSATAVISGARILKEEVISLFTEGIVNFHPGLLPQTSGLDAFYYAVKKDIPLGVTTHFINEKVDEGVEISFIETPLNEHDTVETALFNQYQTQLLSLREFLRLRDLGTLAGTPIHRPVKNDPMSNHEKEEMLKKFGDWRASRVSKTSNMIALQKLVSAGESLRAREMIEQDLDLIEARSPEGWTPLIMASFWQEEDLVDFLLGVGADPNTPGRKATTPLMYAKSLSVEKGTAPSRVLSLLLAAGADPQATDVFGRDVFYYLHKANRRDIADFINLGRAT